MSNKKYDIWEDTVQNESVARSQSSCVRRLSFVDAFISMAGDGWLFFGEKWMVATELAPFVVE